MYTYMLQAHRHLDHSHKWPKKNWHNFKLTPWDNFLLNLLEQWLAVQNLFNAKIGALLKIDHNQGDQMFYVKNRPKCGPYFFC
jgi:hypothetical protein